jgi:hypothetical protein
MKVLVVIKREPAPEQRVNIGPNSRVDEPFTGLSLSHDGECHVTQPIESGIRHRPLRFQDGFK